MATYTDNYNLIKPTYAEVADILPLNNNFEKIDEVMHSSQISLAPAYDQTKEYAAGDTVMYELLMYKCTAPTTGVWDPSKWERTTASESGEGGSAELDILGEGSGAVVSFADGASAELAKCIVEIVPKQDLHGYSKPWAGGVGKNKLPLKLTNIKTLNSGTWTDNSITIAGVTYTVNTDSDGNVISITADGTATAQSNFTLAVFDAYGGQYTLGGCPSGGANTNYNIRIDDYSSGTNYCVDDGSGTSSQTMNVAVGTSCRARIRVYANVNPNGAIFYPQLEAGTTPTAFEPYTNICSISGYTAVKVDVARKNLCRVNSGNNKIVAHCKSGYTYTFSIRNQGNCGFNLKKNTTEGEQIVRQAPSTDAVLYQTFTADEDFDLFLNGFGSGGSSFGSSAYDYQLELGSYATTYEAYAGSTTTTSLGQTVYGGQLNVLTGELTIDRATVDLGSFNWVSESATVSGLARVGVEETRPLGAVYNQTPICSNYEGVAPKGYSAFNNGEIGFSNNEANPMIRVRDQNFASMTDVQIKSAMNGVQMCYYLATPQTVQLTPQEVNSLLGQNNISADTGDIDIVYVKASAPIQPNPTGTPTATLSKLGIEGTVFEVPSGGGGSSGEVIITGQERVVGTYNNKPLYQLDIQADDITGNVNITQAPTSIGRLVSYKGCAYDRTNDQYVALPLYATSSYYMRLYIYNGYIYMEIASSVRVDVSLSLRYTKITD